MEGDEIENEEGGSTTRKTPSREKENVATPDSAGRPKSTASGEIVFEAKKRKRKGTPSLPADEGHEVTFTVTIAMAIPTVYDLRDSSPSAEHDDQPDLREMLKKRMIDAPRAQNYYHLEYYLLPEEDELMKTDVVTYGVACKIYMERHDAKVVKTWQDGDITWFAWAHSHTVTVTKEMLLKMFNHTIELRVWDTKDKCSTRARFDRPKAFRLPQPKPGEKPEDIGGVKAMVTKQMKHYVSQQPRKGVPIRPLPSQVSLPNLFDGRKQSMDSRRTRSGQISSSAATKVLVAVPAKDAREGKSFDRLGQLAGAERLEERSQPKDKKSGAGSDKDKKSTVSSPIRSPQSRGQTLSGAATSDRTDKKSKQGSSKDDRELRKQLAEQAKANAEYIKKYGVCMIPLRLALLFGDRKNVTSRLENPIPGIEDMFLGVSVNCPLLSPSQKEELNPMMIQIQSATCLPATPMSYADLKLKCHPVYCKYKFFKEPEHLTPGKDHDRNIYWDDTNVVLLGTMEPSELREYFNGRPMEIEVHDRDRKPEEVALKPTLFGDDLEDEKIANVGTVESRRTLHNPFHGRDKPWDPYGVAKVDLSELLLGHRFLEMKIPIHNCPIPDVLGTNLNNQGRLMGVAGAVDGPVERPLSAGHYVQDAAMLKLKIELAHPLTTPAKLAAKEYIPTSIECPFSRIIFMFDYQNLDMLHKLQTLVMGFNARALDLASMPQRVIDAALSTYKLSVVQQCSLDLDIVTGFHVLDGERHIFVLEGLRDKAIGVLWETLPQPADSDVRVLYNSDLSFSKRLYGPLDVDLCRVKLHEPLSVIVQQSLLYIRDMVVKPCFDALTKLDQMTKMKKMKDVVRNELFPTAEMVVSMSREFGVPFTQQDYEELQPIASEETNDQLVSEPVSVRPYRPEPSRSWTPIDNFNESYIEHIKKGKKRQNYVQANIVDVQTKSEASHAERAKNKKPHISIDMDPAFNYSTQHLNSMEQAREKLRQYLKEQDPSATYAYNKEFNSALFCPVNLEQERKDAEAADKAQWRTERGWTFPGMKTTKESNVHPRKLDTARLDELRDEWKENFFHTNVFKSPLDRDHYPWPLRHEDLDLYTRPPPDFGNKEPYSIHLPGVKQIEEKMAAKVRQKEDWESRVVVDDVRQHFHRLLPETEMRESGFYSSNQLDKMKGMLKDPIRKPAMMMAGPNVNDIPPLYVVNNPLVDTLARLEGVPLYPAIPDSAHPKFHGYNPGDLPHSWAQEDNHIPCYFYDHDTFKELKGHDFNFYHKNRSKLSRRPILALRPEERKNHLFRIPFSASPYARPLPAVGDSSQPQQNECQSHHICVEVECSASETTEPSASTSEPQITCQAGDGSSLEVNPPTAMAEPPQQPVPVMA